MINEWLLCPEDCGDPVTLPAISPNQLCTSYKQRYSQILGIVFVPNGATDPIDCTAADCDTAPVIVADSLDNSDVTGTKSKYVVGEGGIAVPDKIVDEYPARQARTSFRTFTITHTVKNLECDMYDFLRTLQCGDTSFKIYYTTVGGWIFGCPDGISITSVDVDFPHGEGREDKEFATLTITFEATGDPVRYKAPKQLIDQTAEAAANP